MKMYICDINLHAKTGDILTSQLRCHKKRKLLTLGPNYTFLVYFLLQVFSYTILSHQMTTVDIQDEHNDEHNDSDINVSQIDDYMYHSGFFIKIQR